MLMDDDLINHLDSVVIINSKFNLSFNTPCSLSHTTSTWVHRFHLGVRIILEWRWNYIEMDNRLNSRHIKDK